jgi:hypothetical protein
MLSPAAPHLTPNFLHTRETLEALLGVVRGVVNQPQYGPLCARAQCALMLYEQWRRG